MTRRLLTILAADIAGYSRQIEANEEQALEHLTALRRIMDPIITGHDGHIANTAGDSVVAWFESPVQALRAATEFQQAHKSYNDQVPAEDRLFFRVGINLGDVTVQTSGDILGHGVNMAARLEALAEPGGICLSQNVMEQVEGKVEFVFSKVGEHQVKNMAKPVIVYSVGETAAMTVRFRRYVHRVTRNRVFPVIIATCLPLIAGVMLWFAFGQDGARENRASISPLLKESLTPDEILASFDLVTTGRFQNHTYHVIRTWGGEWPEIEQLASALGGYPVAIGSQEENDFVFGLSLQLDGHWVVYEGKYHEGPMIGLVQKPGAPEPAEGWLWQNGEPVTYTNWAEGAPDNWRGNQNLANFANPRRNAPSPEWGDSPGVHASVVIEVPD